MEELQTGDAMAFASIMYWHVLGEDHFDLNRIISALVACGEEEDCSMIEVIKRIQNTPTRSQTRVAKSTHSDTGRADGKPQGQPPDGGVSRYSQTPFIRFWVPLQQRCIILVSQAPAFKL